jgi:hypothetical protein
VDDQKLVYPLQIKTKSQASGLLACVRMVRRQGLEPRTR